MANPLLDTAVQLLDEYKRGNRGGVPDRQPSLYGYVRRDGSHQSVIPAACHAGLDQYNRNEAIAIAYVVEGYPPVKDLDLFKRGDAILRDPERSPWRSLFHGITEHENGLILSGELPANLAVNFLIARRAILYEYPTQRKVWWSLIEAGCDPYVSLLFAHSFHWLTRGVEKLPMYPNQFQWPGGHGFVDGTADVGNFLAGEPRNLSGKFIDGASYRPCNIVWERDEDYRKTLARRYPDHGGPNAFVPVFHIPDETTLISIVQQEEKLFETRIHH